MPKFKYRGSTTPREGQEEGTTDGQAIDLNNKGQSPSKSFLADFKEINDDDKQDKQGSVNKHVADMRSDRSTFFCNRASGLSARPQDQQSSENDSKEDVCCVCLEVYSGEDQPVLTKCCDTIIGSYCNAQNIAETGECWNCGHAGIQSEAVSEVGSWRLYDPKDSAEERSRLQENGALLPPDDAKTTTVESQSCLENGSDCTSSSPFQNGQQHVLGLTSRVQKQQEARQYLMEATHHLVDMCNAYNDEIDDVVMNEILEALQGCKPFQAAIDKHTLESTADFTTQPVYHQESISVDVSDLKPGEEGLYCSNCEALEIRMKKALDALYGA